MSQIQTIYLLKEVTGREGRKTCRKTMCNEKGEKFWGAEKMGLVNSQQEELQRLGSTGTGPRRIRNISPQQRQERKFQIKKDTKHRPAHTQELSELQAAQHLHHLKTNHLQLSGTCFRSNSAEEGSSPPATFLSHALLWMWGFIKTQWRSALGVLIT